MARTLKTKIAHLTVLGLSVGWITSIESFAFSGPMGASTQLDQPPAQQQKSQTEMRPQGPGQPHGRFRGKGRPLACELERAQLNVAKAQKHACMVNLKIKSRKDPDHAGGLTCAKEHSAVESALKAVSACFHKADLARQQAKKEGSDPKAAESSAEEVKVDESALKAAEKEAEVAE